MQRAKGDLAVMQPKRQEKGCCGPQIKLKQAGKLKFKQGGKVVKTYGQSALSLSKLWRCMWGLRRTAERHACPMSGSGILFGKPRSLRTIKSLLNPRSSNQLTVNAMGLLVSNNDDYLI